jgi:hypothetical protein
MRSGRTLRLVVVAALGATVWCAAAQARGLAPLSFTPPDAITEALASGRITTAQAALERARSLFRLPSVRTRYGFVLRPGPRDATLILRDLVARRSQLPQAERAEAAAILARPDDVGGVDPETYDLPASAVRVDCTTDFCVHWVPTTADAPPSTDTDGDTIPDYVETAEQTLETIWQKEIVELGYRPPLSDLGSPNHGPDARIDVYLANLGALGLYGYCTTDDPNASDPSYPYSAVSAYCVLDNDFSASEFTSGANGTAALQVTAAHEFFHAVQAAYDFFDDLVFIEGTATWMEDEVFDEIDDNRQYFAASALTRPNVPFDLAISSPSSNLFGFQYGAWVFFRYLSDTFGSDLIRRSWELASDASSADEDEYSLQAIDHALAARGSSFRDAFAGFAAANAFPALGYHDAETADWPSPQPSRTAAVRAARPLAGAVGLDHLTSWYGVFTPGAGAKASSKLAVALDLPASARGSTATILVVRKSGAVRAVVPRLNAKGDATVAVAFGRGAVAGVELVLTNASARYQCWQRTVLACSGLPLDDDQRFRYSVRLR